MPSKAKRRNGLLLKTPISGASAGRICSTIRVWSPLAIYRVSECAHGMTTSPCTAKRCLLTAHTNNWAVVRRRVFNGGIHNGAESFLFIDGHGSFYSTKPIEEYLDATSSSEVEYAYMYPPNVTPGEAGMVDDAFLSGPLSLEIRQLAALTEGARN